ncbi:DDE-domain-containing protein [Coniophora puteana RWD-64-598 SS2]|uniref:DDE-domain-containing protein n=1 Tax=Coniophora puteana (strain RWD-64-598) TaxID=741705 RepID=A0A5M3MW65_CONPW|nr:DDE-domain-containing protein [Coniophora puteana RWD-64-598 SS2]EIW82955.1 DDE-domain-containing protein [Coniophora puteana RWD-64-598 SS2]
MGDGLLLTGEVLRKKWRVFAAKFGVLEADRLPLSAGWLTRFKQTLRLKAIKRHREAASAGGETFPPDHGLANKKQSGVKGDKKWLTYAFTANAMGTEKLPPIVIRKAWKPRCFGEKTGKQLGFDYHNNGMAWMVAEVYGNWLRDWDEKLCCQNRRILLLQGNFSGHIVPDDLQCIRVEKFSPNLTAHVQPMDQGIIMSFKANYRAFFTERSIDHYNSGITPGNIYKINQLEAMRLADQAWHAHVAGRYTRQPRHSGRVNSPRTSCQRTSAGVRAISCRPTFESSIVHDIKDN